MGGVIFRGGLFDEDEGGGPPQSQSRIHRVALHSLSPLPWARSDFRAPLAVGPREQTLRLAKGKLARAPMREHTGFSRMASTF